MNFDHLPNLEWLVMCFNNLNFISSFSFNSFGIMCCHFHSL